VTVTIAGSDSGGGAGIQADLKTFGALGVHGTSAITAITAQNTTRVSDVLELPVELVRAQLARIVEDFHPTAAKTGMLSSPEIIVAVAEVLRELRLRNLVVDPVMVAKSGARLLRDDAVGALRRELLPLAELLTPNLPEAEVLLGTEVKTLEQRRRAANELVGLGARAVVVKGGHADGEPIDVYFDGRVLVELPGSRVETRNSHGSGCVFSAAIAANLARGAERLDAVRLAKDFVQGAIANGLELGAGAGPVNPFYGSTMSSTSADQEKSGAPYPSAV
jgi:hydroxymethylpyrimidine/phosphomethylpyrimidine kinase